MITTTDIAWIFDELPALARTDRSRTFRLTQLPAALHEEARALGFRVTVIADEVVVSW